MNIVHHFRDGYNVDCGPTVQIDGWLLFLR